MSFNALLLIVLVTYFGVVLLEGYFSFRRSSGEADYLVAGRKVGPWICGASLSATQMSAGTFVGTIALHYLTGASFIWAWTGIWVAYVVAAIWVAPKLRRYSAEHGGLTFPDYIGDRFNSDVARVVAAVVILICYIVFMSAQYQAGGVILQTLFGLPFVWGALILLVITVLYTTIGGMVAVMRTDFLQQIVMATGAVIGLPLLIAYAGGTGNIAAVLADVGPNYLGWHFGFRDLFGFALAFGLVFVTAPYVITRYYAVPDDRTARQAAAVALVFNVITAASVATIALTMKVLYPQLIVADAASTVYAAQVLPPLMGALVIAAILAAIMSTVDSVLLVTGPVISHDIYYRLINPRADERTRMRVNRWATAITGGVPILLTLQQLGIVQFIVNAFASLLASGIAVPVILGLYWRRASTAGAIASMGIGFGVALVLYWQGQPALPLVGKLNPVIPGVVASALSMLIASALTQPVPERNLRPFFPGLSPTSAAGGSR
ncbi:MAG: sodium/solute symporter [Candidatus Rokubacteria bacterium]|nr:sodium/solute symporter [Candidatus Rokubacteria bacterium]